MRNSLGVLASLLLAPIAFGVLLVRRSLHEGLRERLGGLSKQEPGGIWVHGASAGEARAASSLMSHFSALGFAVFGSCVTSAGREVLRRSAPEFSAGFAPIDLPFCVGRAMKRVGPRALVLVETELWPVLITTAHIRDIPVWIASGRISDRSFARYHFFRRFVAKIFRRLEGVAARSQTDAERFAALGVAREKICLLGDLKLDPSMKGAHLATDLVRATACVPIFVAGCTHPGEERAALDALAACQRAGWEVALVIAPRHLARQPEVEELIRASGRRLVLRSRLKGAPLANGDVLLLDSIGELAALYAAARVAFVGGTLADVGGHNLLEPLFEGCPVLFGPDTRNVIENAVLAIESGAGIAVESSEELARKVVQVIADSKEWKARGEFAKRFLESRRGSAARIAHWIATELNARERNPR